MMRQQYQVKGQKLMPKAWESSAWEDDEATISGEKGRN